MTRRNGTRTSFRLAAAAVRRYQEGIGVTFRQFARVVGEEIMTDVKASRPGAGVPRDEGTLAASGKVTGPKPAGPIAVYLTFGNSAAPYAMRQHEDLTYRHPLGEARYLVRGVERWEPNGSAATAALAAQAAALIAIAADKTQTKGRRKLARRIARKAS